MVGKVGAEEGRWRGPRALPSTRSPVRSRSPAR